MKLIINSHIKRFAGGEFKEGKVLFQSIVTNKEFDDIPTSLVVNLSKSQTNPQCDTPIKCMEAHNNHAGTFHSHSIMREYINSVVSRVESLISNYNMELEELQSTKKKLPHVVLEDNDDLAPVSPTKTGVSIPKVLGLIMLDEEGFEIMQDIQDAMDFITDEDEDDG
jgi:hypothetical protein